METRPERKLGAAKFTRTLEDVLADDFFATQLFMRELFIPDYDPQEFNTVLRALKWIKEDNNLYIFEKSVTSDATGNEVPDYVKECKRTIVLFFEKGRQVDKSNISSVPVAYSLGTSSMIKELKSVVERNIEIFKNYSPKRGDSELERKYSRDDLEKIYKFLKSNGKEMRGEASDILSTILFDSYWRVLEVTAKVITASGNRSTHRDSVKRFPEN